jgi:uncharacterized alkaline shock family protein YloU
MKKLNKLILVLFSVIILIIGVMINLLAVGWLDYDTAFTLIRKALTESPSNKIILIITEFSMLFAILAIFVDTSDKKEPKGGRDVLMQNDNGKLMISRDTIENLVNSVVKNFNGAKEANTRIQLDSENNVSVLVDLTVTKDVVIKELTLNMQNKIKEEIKKTSDLEVKEVNVRIKDIAKTVEETKAQ